jgi:hypothetical protein
MAVPALLAPVLWQTNGSPMAKTAIVKQGTSRQLAPRRYSPNAEGILALYAALACEDSTSETREGLRAKFGAQDAKRPHCRP